MRNAIDRQVRVRSARRKVTGRLSFDRLEARELLALVVTPLSLVEEVPFSGQVATFAAGDIQGVLADFKPTITWGDGTTTEPAGAQVLAVGSGFEVIAPKTYSGFGTFPVTVKVTGANNTSIFATGTATVANAPIILNGTTFSATAGQTFSGVVASFQDGNSDSVPGDFGITIQWGDGTSSTGTAVLGAGQTGGTRRYDVTGQHVYASAGTRTATITVVRLASGQTDTATSTATVLQPSLTVTGASIAGTANVALTDVVLATVVDSNTSSTAADFTATIHWGAGLPTTSGTVVAIQGPTPGSTIPGQYQVRGTFTYFLAGTYAPTITIVRTKLGQTVTATATAVIAAPALVAQGTPITATAGELFEGRVATFTDSTPGNIASDYTASINWGTSTTQGSIVAIGPGAYEVRGQFTFTGAGSFPVAVTITRQGGGASATANSTATVSATFTATSIGAISASAGVPFTGVVARVNDGQTGSQATGLSAVIDWGDGQTSAGSISAPAGGVFSVVGTHTYAAPGSYQVRTTVTRASDGATVESVLQANVFVFSGGLDPLSAAGVVGGASITFQDQPILSGVAPPGSTINLFLRRPNGGDPLPLADTIADSTGRWSLIVGPLDAKKFLLYGVAVPTNSPASPIALLNGGIPIRVLAHPIRVQAHSVIARGNRVTARILAADFAGETEAELGTAAYRLIDRQGREWAPTVVKLARPVGKRGAQSATVTLLFSRGLTLQRGRFDLRVAMDGLADKEGKAVEDLRVRVRKG